MAGDLVIECAAKINLYLNVTSRRPDGYHEIETLFQPISLYDRIVMRRAESGIELVGDDPAVPWNEENLCHIAASMLIDASGCRRGVRIEVEKRIPSGAGLGGGSSDAAAVLAGLNVLMDLGFSRERLMEIALGVGSDVPFFLFGGAAIGRGRGERLESAQGLPDGRILIVKPNVIVSTKWAYENIKMVLTEVETGDRLRCLSEGLRRYPEIPVETYNAFEYVVIGKYPVIGAILERLRSENPILCSLSGSGSACFAVFSSAHRAKEVGDLFSGEGYYTVIARPVIQAVRLRKED